MAFKNEIMDLKTKILKMEYQQVIILQKQFLMTMLKVIINFLKAF